MISNIQMNVENPVHDSKTKVSVNDSAEISPSPCYNVEILNNLLSARSNYKVASFCDLLHVLEEVRLIPDAYLPPEILKLRAMEQCLKELDAIIGQTKLKNNLLRLVLFCAQNLHQKTNAMMNLCLFGSSGVGKSAITKIIADIYYHAGLLSQTAENQKERFLRGTRSTMIGRYLGETARLTQSVINQAIAEQKVLLIDEAYQMNHPDKRDSFSKEMLDTLNQNLSEYPDKLRVILAGYKQDVIECFFGGNQGLERRIGFIYELEAYTHSELRAIFFQQLFRCSCDVENRWKVATDSWFKKHKDTFIYAGGDMENLAKSARIHAAQRSFGTPYFFKNLINGHDLDQALEELKNGRLKEKPDLMDMYM